RRAAARADYALHVLLEMRQLGRVEGPHEVLLAQELEERDEAAVLRRAPPVLKARAALHVVREEEARAAPGAREVLAEWVPLRRPVVVDGHEEAQDASRSQREALPLVEPQPAAGVADVDGDDGAVVPLELLAGHRLTASRAVQCCEVVGHGALC